MTTRRSTPMAPITIADDGEAMGTLRQFARDLNVPADALLRCAESHDRAIVLSNEEGASPLLILDPDALKHLPACAQETPGSAPQ